MEQLFESDRREHRHQEGGHGAHPLEPDEFQLRSRVHQALKRMKVVGLIRHRDRKEQRDRQPDHDRSAIRGPNGDDGEYYRDHTDVGDGLVVLELREQVEMVRAVGQVVVALRKKERHRARREPDVGTLRGAVRLGDHLKAREPEWCGQQPTEDRARRGTE